MTAAALMLPAALLLPADRLVCLSRTKVEDEEFRVKASLLKARTVFQKLVFYAADHPSLKPLIDELRKLQDHKVRQAKTFSTGFPGAFGRRLEADAGRNLAGRGGSVDNKAA